MSEVLKVAQRCKRCGRKIATARLLGMPVVIEDTPMTRAQPISAATEPACECKRLTVTCPVTIVGPHPPPGFLRAFPDLKPNQPCGLKVDIVRPAPTMHCRCARGHEFLASMDDVEGAA